MNANKRPPGHRPAEPLRPVSLCADDYGLRPGIGTAIRSLIETGRLSTISCVTLGAHWKNEAILLRPIAARVEVGLHFVLTDLPAAGRLPGLAPAGQLPALSRLIIRALSGRIDESEIAAELHRQLDRFESAYGRPPAFLDGHQHVHQLPGIGAAVLGVYESRLAAGGCWLRRSVTTVADIVRGRAEPLRGAVVTLLGSRFTRDVRRRGHPCNLCFRGLRRFAGEAPYPALFARYIADLGARPLIMCHPGVGDGESAGDEIATARDEEYRFLMSDAFCDAIGREGLTVQPLTGLPPVAGGGGWSAQAAEKT